ncbi:MAG TPA: hypothetical protein PKI03_05055 [Pseudomonadota bacterium]|nr:hypothetical protein [Pseudomonadota bacterium]
MPQPSASPQPLASLRCTLDYPALDDFIARFGRNLSRAGLFLPMREPLEVGSAVRFEVVLSDARVALRGEGVVSFRAPYEPGANERLHGMGVRFTRLDGHSREVIERVMAYKAAHREEFFEPARDPVLTPPSPFAFVAPLAAATPALTPSPAPAASAVGAPAVVAPAVVAPAVVAPAVVAPAVVAPAAAAPAGVAAAAVAPVAVAAAPVATVPATMGTSSSVAVAIAPAVTTPAPAVIAPAPAATLSASPAAPIAATMMTSAPAPASSVPTPAATTPPSAAAAVPSPSQRTPVMSQRTPVRSAAQSAQTPRLRPTDSAQTPKIELPVPAAATGPRTPASDSARTPATSSRTPARSARTPIIPMPASRTASAQAADDELTALRSPSKARVVPTSSPEAVERLQDLLSRRPSGKE